VFGVCSSASYEEELVSRDSQLLALKLEHETLQSEYDTLLADTTRLERAQGGEEPRQQMAEKVRRLEAQKEELARRAEDAERRSGEMGRELEEMGGRCSELVDKHEAQVACMSSQMTELKIDHENLLNEFDKIFQLNKELREGGADQALVEGRRGVRALVAEGLSEEREVLALRLEQAERELQEAREESGRAEDRGRQQMRYLEEQVRLYQADCAKARHENDELRAGQARNNAELSQLVQNYEAELAKAAAQAEAARKESDRLRLECDRAAAANVQLTEEVAELRGQTDRQRLAWEKERAKLVGRLNRAKNEAESAGAEAARQAEELAEGRARENRLAEEQQRQL